MVMIDPDCICYVRGSDRYPDEELRMLWEERGEVFKNNPLVTIKHDYEETISKEEEEYIKMDIDITKSAYLENIKNGRLTAPIQSVTIDAGRINGKSITTDSSINMKSSFAIATMIAAKLPNKSKAQIFGILPKKVIYRDKYTIVIWEDGTKTIVKCSEGDTFDKEKGFLMALTTHLYGKGVMNYLRKECCGKVEKINEFGDQEG